ncbi:MAG: protein-L-isoaspartate(D-aspartate) O-methyltransferase [Bacteroidales bacterium]|nr:protein-L-isoaspartate(D-aspartate) O-methyltransferase [Bacteroidales bacterium]
MQDLYKHKGLRKKLVETIKNKGIKDEKVLAAMEKIPRHYFMDSSFLEYAYQDKPFPIGAGQTISQPFTVAFMTELLDIKKGDKIMEIGTGSGYQSCMLAELGAKVYSIERQKSLFKKNEHILNELGYFIKAFYGDGYLGLPTYAPFDKIIVTAGAPYIPEPLKQQLKNGGILVIPVGKGSTQIMTKITKISQDEYQVKEFGTFAFVPLLIDKEDKKN